MQKHDLCTANFAINEYTTVHRSPEAPVSYAEIEYMRFVLGEDAVTDVEVVRTEETTTSAVHEALSLKFGKSKVAEAFPGTRPRLPLQAPADVPRYKAPETEAETLTKPAGKTAGSAKAEKTSIFDQDDA
jgi:hypothetical protein